MKKNNGVTLIVLAVTIVILTILSGVAINQALGDGGLINKTKDEKNTSRIKLINEAIQSYNLENKLGPTAEDIAEVLLRKNLINEDEKAEIDQTDRLTIGNETILVKKRTKVDEKAKYNSTIDGRSPHSYNPIIPEGYTPINAGSATWGDGTTNPARNSVDHGLVIKDDAGNEWVWIPVEASVLSSMYVTSNDGIALAGDVGATTKLYTNSTTIGKTGDTKIISRSTPNATYYLDYREPDLIVGSDGASYDKNEAYYKTILGYDTPKAMAEVFIRDYANMITSIKKYGGFYIGRYELSNAGIQKGKDTLTNMDWYNLYKKCTTLNASNNVESKMIWGIQWDLTCDFISKKGEQKSITDSREWGNYIDSEGDAAVMDGTTQKYGSKQVTGYSEYWKANNIYDLAGNCCEWTQEASAALFRVDRGGYYSNKGAVVSAPGRASPGVGYSDFNYVRFSPYFNNKVALGEYKLKCVEKY